MDTDNWFMPSDPGFRVEHRVPRPGIEVQTPEDLRELRRRHLPTAGWTIAEDKVEGMEFLWSASRCSFCDDVEPGRLLVHPHVNRPAFSCKACLPIVTDQRVSMAEAVAPEHFRDIQAARRWTDRANWRGDPFDEVVRWVEPTTYGNGSEADFRFNVVDGSWAWTVRFPDGNWEDGIAEDIDPACEQVEAAIKHWEQR